MVNDLMENQPLYIADYNYPLPDERIAKYPLPERDHSKLLVYRDGKVSEDLFYNVGDYIAPNSLLIYNNTRVIQARLAFHKPTGARIEVFLLEPLWPHDYQLALSHNESCSWKCMIGNAKKWHEEDKLEMPVESLGLTLYASKKETMGNAYEVDFRWENKNVTFAEILDAVGELPIPPYLNRPTEERDKTTYQTVYSRIKGSVAAPTAGLHFTENVLSDLRQRGIKTDEVTLHVGAGTFLPVKTADANKHIMHKETIVVEKKTIEHIIKHLGHIVAVGTTSMRTLESLYFIGVHLNNYDFSGFPYEMCRFEDYDWISHASAELHVSQFEPYEKFYPMHAETALKALVKWMDRVGVDSIHAETEIMIKPGYQFRIVDQLITNFHQPQSTLLLLVSAFVDGDWKTIYDYALSHDFRFLSYGDSSILTRNN